MSLITPDRAHWTPLLSRDLRSRSIAAIRDIAIALRDELLPGQTAAHIWGPISGRKSSLFGGHAGIAIFLSFCDRALPEEGFADLAVEAFEASIDGMNQPTPTQGLFQGFPGIAWTLELLRDHLTEEATSDLGAEVAQVIHDRLRGPEWQHGYDLTSGLVGLGLYAIERGSGSFGRATLERVVELLAERRSLHPDGVAWLTPPREVPRNWRTSYPTGCFDLGLAHGIPGIVAFLSRVLPSGVARGEVEPLLRGAASWLLGRQKPLASPSFFPYRVSPGLDPDPNPTRVAWCYGDLGLAAALLSAGRTLDCDDLQRKAKRIALAAAKRPVDEDAVAHPGLCHGAAGNAHIYNRLFQASGEGAFATAAITWYQRLLDLRAPGSGVAGFSAYILLDDGEMAWHADPGFLTGAAGIGLALLAGVSSIEPFWDRALLLPQLDPLETL